MNSHTKHNDGFDLYKSLLALFIVAIHTVKFTKIPAINFIAFPLLRLAVPIFFLFSGYFFFKRADRLSVPDQLALLKRSVIRDLQLYAFWFVVLFPVTLADRQYFIHGLATGLYYLMVNFFLGSTFIASWYIMALVIGMPLVYFASRLLNNWWLLLGAWLINVWCSLLSNWGLSPVGRTLWASLQASHIPIYPYMSFPIGLIWLVLGKMFADGDLNFLMKKTSLWLTAAATCVLYGEQYIVTTHHYILTNDSYIMLVPVAVSLFGFLLTTHLTLPHASWLRPFSTVTYCMHASLAMVIRFLLERHGLIIDRFLESLALWAVVVILSWLVTLLIIRLEKVQGLHWLRFSH